MVFSHSSASLSNLLPAATGGFGEGCCCCRRPARRCGRRCAVAAPPLAARAVPGSPPLGAFGGMKAAQPAREQALPSSLYRDCFNYWAADPAPSLLPPPDRLPALRIPIFSDCTRPPTLCTCFARGPCTDKQLITKQERDEQAAAFAQGDAGKLQAKCKERGAACGAHASRASSIAPSRAASATDAWAGAAEGTNSAGVSALAAALAAEALGPGAGARAGARAAAATAAAGAGAGARGGSCGGAVWGRRESGGVG